MFFLVEQAFKLPLMMIDCQFLDFQVFKPFEIKCLSLDYKTVLHV